MARAVTGYVLFVVGCLSTACTVGVAALDPSTSKNDLGVIFTPDDLSGQQTPNDLTGKPPADLTGVIVDLKNAPADLLTTVADMTTINPADMVTVTGSLSGSVAALSGTTDLSAEGTSDWAHWGLNGNGGAAGETNHKAGMTALISMTNTGTLRHFAPYSRNFTWNNGTPTATANSNDGTYLNNQGNAYTITVPASTTTRTLKLYVLVFQSTCTLNAHLSDSSATDYTNAQTSGGGSYQVYTLVYRSASASQTLTVTWTFTNDANNGSVDLLAATLQ